MNILLVGATGFIGRALTPALANREHRIIGLSRKHHADTSQCSEWRRADLAEMNDPRACRDLLAGIDVVINAAGVLSESNARKLWAVHGSGPAALFSAAAQAGIKRIIQISALADDTSTDSPFILSKQLADRTLADLPTNWIIVQPSLVFGPDGRSAKLFTSLASLPCIPIPGCGHYRIQPVHVNDLVEAIVALVEREMPRNRRIALVGPAPIMLSDFLEELRKGMQLPKARLMPIPEWIVSVGARVAGVMPNSLVTSETWNLLKAGSTGDAAELTRLLGRSPRHYGLFVAEAPSEYRKSAMLRWLLALLRNAIALVWIVTGVVSVGVYPIDDSYELLARVGLNGALATVALYGAASLDLALGLLIWCIARRRVLWLTQMILIVGYTLIISWALPEFWAHPYGPLIKNLPMLAAIYVLYKLE